MDDQYKPSGQMPPTGDSLNQPSVNPNPQPTVFGPSLGNTNPTPGAFASPPAPAQTPFPDTTNQQNPFPPIVTKSKRKFSKKLALVLVATILVLGGGGAAAYFGYIVPNNPENKLLSALADFALAKEVSSEGSVDLSGQGMGLAIDFKTVSNVNNNQFSVAGTVGVNGAQFPYDVRYIDKSIYAKVSGLGSIDKVAESGVSPMVSSYLEPFKGINDQWYVIDRSFWQSLGEETSCVSDLSLALNDSDMDIIKNAYKKHPLFKVKSTSKEGGDTKYDVEPASDQEATAFVGELNELSILKKIKECGVDEGQAKSVDEEISGVIGKSEATGTMSITTDGDNKLKKIEIDADDEGQKVKISVGFTYGSASVEKPEGAKPIQDLIGNLFGGLALPTQQDNSEASADSERQSEIMEIYVALETYYNEHGYYPAMSNMADKIFIKDTLNLSDDTITDPESTSAVIAPSATAKAYGYTAKPIGCGKDKCTSFTLTATLSDGSKFTKESLNN